MPSAFRYQSYEPANVGTIASLMGLPAQLQGQAAQQIAEATARANAQKADAHSRMAAAIMGGVNQTVGNLGEILQARRDAPIRALQLESMQQQVEAGRQHMLSEKDAKIAHAKLSALVASHQNDDGTPNHQAIIGAMQGDPILAPLVPEYVKQASEADKLLHPDEFSADGSLGVFSKRTGKTPTGEVVTPKPAPPTTASLAVTANDPQATPEARASASAALSRLQQTPAVTETARHNAEMERIQSLTSNRAAAQTAETARHNRAMEAANNPLAALQGGSGGNQSVTGTSAAPQELTGEDFLKQLPAPIASEVKAYAEGRRPFPAGFALKSPYFQSLIQMVGQYDPTFDAANYNARNKSRTDLTSPSGTGGKTINALNTALKHAGQLSDLIESLDNFESPLANAVVNPLRTATGKTQVTNFQAVAPQLAKEIERAWRGAGGSSTEVQQLIRSIGSNLGRQQQREALQQFVELAQGKLDATQQQRDNVMGAAGASIPILFDQNKAVIEKIMKRAAPTGAASGELSEGQEGTVNGVPAVWKTVDGNAGWYKK